MDNKKACITCSREFPSDETVCPDDGTILAPIVKDRYLGTILAGRYEIQKVIGGGGMGLVYKARHVMMNRIVAIKMLHQHLTNSAEALKRFQLEAQAASCLSLPNILTIYDFGVTDESQPFMVMDYLEGTSLADVLDQEKRLPVIRSLNIFIQCCAGLAHAHQKGVLHRDLKPSNIMLVNYGEDQADFVKIVDFGIAKLLNRVDGSGGNLTRTGEVYGSPLYMSPEQCRGQELDARSDLYSFGCVMYKSLTGLPVFSGSEVIELLFKQVSEMPEPFAKAAPDADIPAEMETIVMKSLAKTADGRYNSMSELKDVLEAYKRKLEGDDGPETAEVPAPPTQSTARLSSKFVGHASAAAASVEFTQPAEVKEPAKTVGALNNELRAAASGAAVAPATAASAPPSVPIVAASPAVPRKEELDAIPSKPAAVSAVPGPTESVATIASMAKKNSGESRTSTPRSTSFGRKSKPEWWLALEGAFANRLVLASVAGLIVATAAVAYMAVNAEKLQHIVLPKNTETTAKKQDELKPASKQTPVAKQAAAQTYTANPKTSSLEKKQPPEGTVKTSQATEDTTDPEPDATNKKATRKSSKRSSRTHTHRARRHAYSSYGF